MLQALDQRLEARGHPVQLVRQSTQLVAAVELDPLLVGAGADAGGCRLHPFDGTDETASKQDAQADPGRQETREQERRSPDLSADRRERLALGLLDEDLPADRHTVDRLDGRPRAQHLLPTEVASDRRSDS